MQQGFQKHFYSRSNTNFRIPTQNNQTNFNANNDCSGYFPPSSFNNMPPYPMFGPRGATVPPKFIPNRNRNNMFQPNNTPSNNLQFWCDTCDKGFRSTDLLKQHQSQHEKCKIDGCQFIAHPNIITKHIQMQHSSGLFKKISKLSTPEEISSWIAERKKRYPTKLNIQCKKASEEEKQKRGEKLNIENHKLNKGGDFRKYTDRHFPINQEIHNKRNNLKKKKQNNTFQKKNDAIKRLDNSEVTVQRFGNLNHFKGTHEISKLDIELESDELMKDNTGEIDIDDKDWEEPKENIIIKVQPILCGALANLINCYGSSDEEEAPLEKKKNSILDDKSVTQRSVDVTRSIDDDDSGPIEIKIERTETDDLPLSVKIERKEIDKQPHCNNKIQRMYGSNNKNVHKANKDRQPHSTFKKNCQKRKLPSTLLEKLLREEINHERNVILQCVNFIRKKNYFNNQTN